MTSRVQVIRSNVAGARPTGRQPGELYVNWADKQLGSVDGTSTSQDLIAVRFFSAAANYAIGAYVIQAGVLYRAIAAITAGAFNVAQWSTLATTEDIGSSYLPLAGGTLTGNVTISPVGSAFLGMNKSTAANVAGITGLSVGKARWSVQLGMGGGESGSNAGSDFGLFAYDDAGNLLSAIGPTLGATRASGYLTVNGYGATLGAASTTANAGNAGFVFNASTSHAMFINATRNGTTRWQLLLGDSVAESGGNAGSNYNINAFSDAGAALGTALSITRSNKAATFYGTLTSALTFQAGDIVSSKATSSGQNPIVQVVKSDGTAIGRMYTLGVGNVAYWDNPTTGASISLSGQINFTGNATFLNSVGVNGNASVAGTFGVNGQFVAGSTAVVGSTLTVNGTTNVQSLISAGHQVNGALGVTGGISMNGGINYNWYSTSAIRFGWDGGQINAGVDGTDQGNLVLSYQPTRVRGIALNGSNQNMYAYYSGGNVHWPFTWNLALLEEENSDFDALEALNSLSVKKVRFQQETEDADEPNRWWPVALTQSDIKAKMSFASVADPKVSVEDLQRDKVSEDQPDIPPMQTGPLEFKMEPMIAALVKAVQQLTARVAELENSPQRRTLNGDHAEAPTDAAPTRNKTEPPVPANKAKPFAARTVQPARHPTKPQHGSGGGSRSR